MFLAPSELYHSFLSEWDFFCYVATPLVVLGAMLAHALAFKGVGARLTEFSGVFVAHPSLRTGSETEKATYGRVWWRVVILNISALPCVACLSAYYVLSFFNEELTPTLSAVIGVMGGFQAYFNLLPPTTSGRN